MPCLFGSYKRRPQWRCIISRSNMSTKKHHSELMKALDVKIKEVNAHNAIIKHFKNSKTYQDWKAGNESQDDMLQALWHVNKTLVHTLNILKCDTEDVSGCLMEDHEKLQDLQAETDSLWRFALRQKIVIARQSARILGHVDKLEDKENVAMQVEKSDNNRIMKRAEDAVTDIILSEMTNIHIGDDVLETTKMAAREEAEIFGISTKDSFDCPNLDHDSSMSS